MLVHARQQRREVFLARQFDADQRRAVLAVALFDVLKQRDVVLRPQGVVQIAAQRAGPLGKLDQEIMLQALVDQTPLDDLRVARDVVVAAAQDADDLLAPQAFPQQRKRRRCSAPRRVRR